MPGESDQTKWVGVRPTDPAEAIPVTESAPVTEVSIIPSDPPETIPVEEQSPVTEVSIIPSDPPETIPVEEQSPLTDIYTKKASPATADLGAYAGQLKERFEWQAGSSGSIDKDFTACPSGEIWVVETISSDNATTAMTWHHHMLRVGTTDFYLNRKKTPGISELLISTPNVILIEDDLIRVKYKGVAINDWLYQVVLGYKVKLY